MPPVEQALAACRAELTRLEDEHAATREILRAISASPTDIQRVFDAIAAAALELCDATSANVATFDGTLIHLAAFAPSPGQGNDAVDRLFRSFPLPPGNERANTRAILGRCVVSIPDVLEDRDYTAASMAAAAGYRSVVSVPLLRVERAMGAITVARARPGPFSGEQIALLQTFADEAVIAIENARLFGELQARNRELTETLEQQTATSEILRVISRSTTDAQPVFEAIATASLRLCEARSANVFTFDGQMLHAAALAIVDPEGLDAIRAEFPRPPGLDAAAPRAVFTRGVVTIPDVLEDDEYMIRDAAVLAGFRSVLAVPLMREGEPIGAIAVGRPVPGPIPSRQVRLLLTFADQAVIAIENARLFRELNARTQQLTQSVEQLRALSEVGQAVSSTLDVGTVLRSVVARALDLVGMDGGAIYEFDEAEQAFRLRATDRLPDELVHVLGSAPMPVGEGAIGRLVVASAPVVLTDILNDETYQSRAREIMLGLGQRSLLALPLLRENRLLGGLVVMRRIPGEFDPKVVALLESFATQSALAIHNARLFREIEEKSRQLETASRHKSAFLANMSHELRTPLNAIIGFARIVMRRTQERIDPRQYENLEKILASGQNLLSLINAILDLAKIEAGHVDIDARELDPTPVLSQCLRTIEPLVQGDVQLVLAVDERLPPMLVDEEKLRQVVVNLLANATKFTQRGRIELCARVAGDAVEIVVADTGIGIAADKLDVIFEEFEQADTSSTRVHGGTGLGLAIARRLARLMGGDIGVRSEIGGGSTFALTLPLRYRSPAA